MQRGIWLQIFCRIILPPGYLARVVLETRCAVGCAHDDRLFQYEWDKTNVGIEMIDENRLSPFIFTCKMVRFAPLSLFCRYVRS